MFDFKVYERAQNKELGTVAQVIGVGGKIGISPANFNGTARLQLILLKANGTSDKATCSTKVSAMMRSKELSLSQIAKFPCVEQPLTFIENGIRKPVLDEEGKQKIVNMITMPAGDGKLIETALADLKEVEYKREAVNYSDLVMI